MRKLINTKISAVQSDQSKGLLKEYLVSRICFYFMNLTVFDVKLVFSDI